MSRVIEHVPQEKTVKMSILKLIFTSIRIKTKMSMECREWECGRPHKMIQKISETIKHANGWVGFKEN